MAEKKYYWLKLRKDFFYDETIAYLEEQEYGDKYIIFYLKLCLKALTTEGILIRLVGEILIPYDTNSLSRLTGTPPDTVRVAMSLFEQIGLIRRLDTGEIYLTQIEEMIGSETDKAALMRRKRAKERLEGNNVTTVLPKRYTEKEIRERDKSIEIDIDIVDDIVDAPDKPETPTLPAKTPKVNKNPPGEFEYKCVEVLINSCLAVFPNSKVPTTPKEKEKWAMDIEKMLRLDHRTEEEIKEALQYAVTDNFWKSNIRSGKKFREKFETLLIQSRSKRGRQTAIGTEQYMNDTSNWYEGDD